MPKDFIYQIITVSSLARAFALNVFRVLIGFRILPFTFLQTIHPPTCTMFQYLKLLLSSTILFSRVKKAEAREVTLFAKNHMIKLVIKIFISLTVRSISNDAWGKYIFVKVQHNSGSIKTHI